MGYISVPPPKICSFANGVPSEATAKLGKEDEGVSEHPQRNRPFGTVEQDRRTGRWSFWQSVQGTPAFIELATDIMGRAQMYTESSITEPHNFGTAR